jgi:outer membrane protein assembly factor BamE
MRMTVRFRLSSLSSGAGSRARAVLGAALAPALVLALSGCSSWNAPEPATARGFMAFLLPYKPDVVQGNVVTTEQISQIKPGMTRTQVRDILGTPLIADPFHAQRWDYVFSMKRQGYEPIQRSFFVTFDGEAVQKIEAPALPSENDFVTLIARHPLPGSVPKLELTDAERAALPTPGPVAVADAASAAAPSGPTRDYPPLEPR